MTKLNPKNIIIPTVVLLVICIVISGALAYTNSITKNKIAKLNEEAEKASMAEIYSDKGTDFEKATVNYQDKEYTYYKASLNSKNVGYIFTTAVNGYGGPVNVMTGINLDGSIKSIKVLSCDDETPGLGATAKGNNNFAKQFSGKKAKLSTEKNKDIQALTGATITTKAVINNVNTARELFEKVGGGR